MQIVTNKKITQVFWQKHFCCWAATYTKKYHSNSNEENGVFSKHLKFLKIWCDCVFNFLVPGCRWSKLGCICKRRCQLISLYEWIFKGQCPKTNILHDRNEVENTLMAFKIQTLPNMVQFLKRLTLIALGGRKTFRQVAGGAALSSESSYRWSDFLGLLYRRPNDFSCHL